MIALLLALSGAEGLQNWTDVEWEPHPGWKVEGGAVERVAKGGNLFSKESFGDFALHLEFKLPPGGNSGLILRSRNNVEHQVEITADARGPVHNGTSGAVFRRTIPTSNAAKPAGEWNRLEVEVRGRVVSVTYNGSTVVDRAVVDDLPFRGPIGLQDHGTPLWFRHVQVRRLDVPRPAWDVEPGPPLSAVETRAFMRALAEAVFRDHLKKAEGSEQRGMIYEYFEVPTKRWIQGEALDTMHDGAWFCAALATAARATGDPYYEEFLTRWTLPFYLRMLNHSDTLFDPERNDADGHRFGLEHQLQKGEKGFVPYWWDDGASFSLEAARKKSGKPVYAATDRLAGTANPEMRLDGWSHGSSNHKAQDLAVMLQTAWVLLREKDAALAARIAEAAKNLQDCRTRHGSGSIPACLAAYGLTNGDAAALRRIAEPKGEPVNGYVRCLLSGEKPVPTPGFADDAEYAVYAAVAKGGPSKEVALRLVYDAFTTPQLLRIWSDTGEIPPGMGRFDLGGMAFQGGKPAAYRSDRPAPMGSRVGPQTMVVCGWALQALEAWPGLWELPGAVPVLDGTYTLDTKPDDRMSEPIALGDASIRLAGHPAAMLVAGTAKGESVVLRLGAKGGGAEVALRRNRTWEAVNDRGEALRLTAHVVPAPEGFAFEFALPWTSAKDQKPWANLIERGAYTVSAGEARRELRIASGEARVKAALRRELGQGLRTWKTIFEAFGYVPTGIGRWDSMADAGGYAHLLKAAAQWLLVLEGKRDW